MPNGFGMILLHPWIKLSLPTVNSHPERCLQGRLTPQQWNTNILKGCTFASLTKWNQKFRRRSSKPRVFFCQHLWDILLMEEILHQLRLVVYPSVYKVLHIPGGAGFLPSTVWNLKLKVVTCQDRKTRIQNSSTFKPVRLSKPKKASLWLWKSSKHWWWPRCWINCTLGASIQRNLEGTFTPPKTKMTMEKETFEDVSPTKNGTFPA